MLDDKRLQQFISFCGHRWHWAFYDLGLLYFSNDVWAECSSHEWISWQKMECRKLSFMVFLWLLPFDLDLNIVAVICWFSHCIHIVASSKFWTFSSLQNNTDPRFKAPTVGKVLLESRGFFTDDYMFWVCVGALIAFSLLFNVMFIAALTLLNRTHIIILFLFFFFGGGGGGG